MSSAAEPSGEARSVHQLFEEKARSAPRTTALVCGSVRLTYGELEARANRLARHLAELGLRRGAVAAVALGREPELLTAVLAVLKAGAAYVPLEPSGPDHTIRHMLSDSDPAMVITQEVNRVRLTDASARTVLCLDTLAGAIAAHPPTPLGVDLQPSDLACVFYTSGSTGLPKGALIEHGNLLHSYRGWRRVYQLSAADRFLQTATLESDVFTAEWIRALCTGGTLVMADRDFTPDQAAPIALLHDLVIREGVTVLETNVHTLRRLFAHLLPLGLELGKVRLLSVGAEKWYLDEQLRLQRYLGPGVRHLNVYGVAEAAVDSTYFDSSTLLDAPEQAERISLIGRPFPGTRVHLLDRRGRPVAPGEAGEICLAGPGLGRGYLRRPELTAERFEHSELDPDGRVHRTGDIGRLRPDGLLEFVGRAVGPDTADPTGATAVAELEAVLRGHPLVLESVVAEIETAPDRSGLVAYVVPAADATTEPGTLRSYLADRLPPNLVPGTVVPLPALPRTRAGRLDRRGLPLPTAPGQTHPHPHPHPYAPPHPHSAPPTTPRPARHNAPHSTPHAAPRAAPQPVNPRPAEPPGAVTWAVLTVLFGALAAVLTDVLRYGSTSLSGVPAPWAGLVRLLYAFECLGFGAAVAFLVLGRSVLERHGRPRGLTVRTLISIAWLLGVWWPQDNWYRWYRVGRATDWPRQVVLVHGFDVSLIVAAVVVVRFLAWRPPGVSAGTAGRAERDSLGPGR
ncbi:amino acid adenylation domain-containing protein [Kitasatospora sp. MAP5-34]|uniref:amino acid adenylation domain-containing protein n=1 Tax=Kitasatospora sp. MAP5-34 TaxID=3035102 RepID=UPI0024762EB1|nr:amino acid adenylation domain-containing protein [Kitasatospora sp. MAP5-34]MDH6576891.1 amino acid adenylation domain-containing protein [Kitasatospora sp. MAP5-34]